MKSDPRPAGVVSIARGEPAATEGICIDGRVIEVSQNHLLEPFLDLVRSVERIAAMAAGAEDGSGEHACLEETYRSLYTFFQVLLPSASHDVIDGLTYSVSLLLVGEAIEASRIVAPGPVVAGEPLVSGRAPR